MIESYCYRSVVLNVFLRSRQPPHSTFLNVAALLCCLSGFQQGTAITASPWLDGTTHAPNADKNIHSCPCYSCSYSNPQCFFWKQRHVGSFHLMAMAHHSGDLFVSFLFPQAAVAASWWKCPTCLCFQEETTGLNQEGLWQDQVLLPLFCLSNKPNVDRSAHSCHSHFLIWLYMRHAR